MGIVAERILEYVPIPGSIRVYLNGVGQISAYGNVSDRGYYWSYSSARNSVFLHADAGAEPGDFLEVRYASEKPEPLRFVANGRWWPKNTLQSYAYEWGMPPVPVTLTFHAPTGRIPRWGEYIPLAEASMYVHWTTTPNNPDDKPGPGAVVYMFQSGESFDLLTGQPIFRGGTSGAMGRIGDQSYGPWGGSDSYEYTRGIKEGFNRIATGAAKFTTSTSYDDIIQWLPAGHPPMEGE